MFLHRLKQRALRLGRSAVHFVRQYHLREDRTGVKTKRARFAVEDRYAEYVGRQQIAGELNALELQSEGRGQSVCKRRFAYAGNVFDQQMTASEHARDREPDLMLLAKDYLTDLADDAIDLGIHQPPILPERSTVNVPLSPYSTERVPSRRRDPLAPALERFLAADVVASAGSTRSAMTTARCCSWWQTMTRGTEHIKTVTAKHENGRMVSTLECGYSLGGARALRRDSINHSGRMHRGVRVRCDVCHGTRITAPPNAAPHLPL
jgi:hypothetical protein